MLSIAYHETKTSVEATPDPTPTAVLVIFDFHTVESMLTPVKPDAVFAAAPTHLLPNSLAILLAALAAANEPVWTYLIAEAVALASLRAATVLIAAPSAANKPKPAVAPNANAQLLPFAMLKACSDPNH